MLPVDLKKKKLKTHIIDDIINLSEYQSVPTKLHYTLFNDQSVPTKLHYTLFSNRFFL